MWKLATCPEFEKYASSSRDLPCLPDPSIDKPYGFHELVLLWVAGVVCVCASWSVGHALLVESTCAGWCAQDGKRSNGSKWISGDSGVAESSKHTAQTSVPLSQHHIPSLSSLTHQIPLLRSIILSATPPRDTPENQCQSDPRKKMRCDWNPN